MKNSEEFLRPEQRKQLTSEQVAIIDEFQFGSRHTLKEKVHEAAMRFIEINSLNQLNSTVRDADASSSRLTAAIKKITLWGVIIALVSLFVAILSSGLEYYKFFTGI